MVANPRRRNAVLDAALAVLGDDGAHALTHRAVDRRAGVPLGTTANYAPTRAVLLEQMAERIFERLRPAPDRLAELERLSGPAAVEEYVGYVVQRLLAEPALALALVELRLEAARSPGVAGRFDPVLRAGLAADVAFHEARGLPGGRTTVVALHHVVNGVVLDYLTTRLDPDADPIEVARRLTRAVVARPTPIEVGRETAQVDVQVPAELPGLRSRSGLPPLIEGTVRGTLDANRR